MTTSRLISVTDPVIIEYRLSVLTDRMANAELLRRLYEIACDAIEVRRKLFLGGLGSARSTGDHRRLRPSSRAKSTASTRSR